MPADGHGQFGAGHALRPWPGAQVAEGFPFAVAVFHADEFIADLEAPLRGSARSDLLEEEALPIALSF